MEATWMIYLAVSQLAVVILFSIWRLTVNPPAIGLAEKDKLSACNTPVKLPADFDPKAMIKPMPKAHKKHRQRGMVPTPYGTIRSQYGGSVAIGGLTNRLDK